MPEYTPHDLRESLLNPLTLLLSQFSEGISRMEMLEREGILPRGELPLRAKMGIDAVATLKALRSELFAKLEAATDGRLEMLVKKREMMRRLRTQKQGSRVTKRERS